jgi:hypothetical protein
VHKDSNLGPVFWLPCLQRRSLPATYSALPLAPDLEAEFDRVFTGKTGFITLDRLLARLHANKAELLKVLDRPEIPLHTNGSENDIRVTSQGAKSRAAPAAISVATHATPSSAAKTCTKLRISFWYYLGARLNLPGAAVPPLANLILARTQPP